MSSIISSASDCVPVTISPASNRMRTRSAGVRFSLGASSWIVMPRGTTISPSGTGASSGVSWAATRAEVLERATTPLLASRPLARRTTGTTAVERRDDRRRDRHRDHRRDRRRDRRGEPAAGRHRPGPLPTGAPPPTATAGTAGATTRRDTAGADRRRAAAGRRRAGRPGGRRDRLARRRAAAGSACRVALRGGRGGGGAAALGRAPRARRGGAGPRLLRLTGGGAALGAARAAARARARRRRRRRGGMRRGLGDAAGRAHDPVRRAGAGPVRLGRWPSGAGAADRLGRRLGLGRGLRRLGLGSTTGSRLQALRVGQAADAVGGGLVDARRVALDADLELFGELDDDGVVDAQLPCQLVDPDLLRWPRRSSAYRLASVPISFARSARRARRLVSSASQRPGEGPPPHRLVEAGRGERRTARRPGPVPASDRQRRRPGAGDRGPAPWRVGRRRHPTQVRRRATRVTLARSPTSACAASRSPPCSSFVRLGLGAVGRRSLASGSRLRRSGASASAASAPSAARRRRASSARRLGRVGRAGVGARGRATRSRPRRREIASPPSAGCHISSPSGALRPTRPRRRPPPDSSSCELRLALDVDAPAGEPRREAGVLAFLADRERQLEVGNDDLGDAGVLVDPHLAHLRRRERLHHELRRRRR